MNFLLNREKMLRWEGCNEIKTKDHWVTWGRQGRGFSGRGQAPALLTLLILALLLSSCGFPGVVSTSAQLPAANLSTTATPLPPIRFPQDEAAHRDLTEWWYYTGHLNASMPGGQVRHYGFELVFFQALRGDLPPVYAAHFAISDITRGEFHFDQRRLTEPNAIIPDGTSTSGIDTHINDWSIKG